MEKAPSTGNPHPRPRFYLCGDGNGDRDCFEGEDGDRKAISGPAQPHCHPYMSPVKINVAANWYFLLPLKIRRLHNYVDVAFIFSGNIKYFILNLIKFFKIK